MPVLQHCPRCGAPLPEDAPGGTCPRCLFEAGFEPGNSSADGSKAHSPVSQFTPPAPEDLAEKFPQLEILELIGQGGMGAVYKARQRKLDRPVALKILPTEMGGDANFAERFAREARMMAKLQHPHIVLIHDFGETNGLHYLLMEYVEGINLREALRDERFATEETLRIVGQIAAALDYAHGLGMIHRDIKPENILLSPTGDVKVADFGLAKLLKRPPEEQSLTATRHAVGTPHYMAPEQWQPSVPTDHRADIYALGVLLYEMLTGELPLGRFEPPSQKATIDPRLDEVVLRAMQTDPENRYRDAAEMGREIAHIAGGSKIPLRIVPDLPRRMRPADVWDPIRDVWVGAWASLGRAWASFWQWVWELPYLTVGAAVLIWVLSTEVIPWFWGTETRMEPRPISIGATTDETVDANGQKRAVEVSHTEHYYGYETAVRIGSVWIENYWPAVAATVIGVLALFRRRLGLKGELLAIALCLYGIAHIFYLFHEWDKIYEISYRSGGKKITDIQYSLAPLAVGLTFAVLLIGNLLELVRRTYTAIEGERNVRSFCRSFGRLLVSEFRDV